jgi:hypothetical protein
VILGDDEGHQLLQRQAAIAIALHQLWGDCRQPQALPHHMWCHPKTSRDKRATKTPAEKTAWKISPENSQSVVEIDIWKKDDLKIEFLKVYRSGWIIVDQLPDLSGYNPDQGVDIFEEFEFDEPQLHSASEETSVFPNELPAEERERLLALSEEELADEGWTLESVTRFSGPLLVEQV